MAEIEIKIEYRTLDEISQRIGKRPKATLKLIRNNQLPVKKIGRDYWMSETAFQDHLRKL